MMQQICFSLQLQKIFELMDEFYGDFIVILADEGNTLDQMFRFAPALAKKFKYVIDISRYTAEDLNLIMKEAD